MNAAEVEVKNAAWRRYDCPGMPIPTLICPQKGVGMLTAKRILRDSMDASSVGATPENTCSPFQQHVSHPVYLWDILSSGKSVAACGTPANGSRRGTRFPPRGCGKCAGMVSRACSTTRYTPPPLRQAARARTGACVICGGEAVNYFLLIGYIIFIYSLTIFE